MNEDPDSYPSFARKRLLKKGFSKENILEAVGEGEAIIEAVKNIVGSSEIRTARNALHPIVIPTEVIESENLNEEEIMQRLKDSL